MDQESSSQPTPADASVNAPVHSLAADHPLDVAGRLQIASCDGCGIIFALPASLFLHRVENGQPIHCPGCGRSISLQTPDEVDSSLARAQLLAELLQLKHQLQLARLELSRRPLPEAQQPIDRKELKRRAEFLVSRAEHGAYGQPICPFCGKQKQSNTRLRDHLRKSHEIDLTELPAGRFAP